MKADLMHVLTLPAVEVIIFDDYGSDLFDVKEVVLEAVEAGWIRIIAFLGTSSLELSRETFIITIHCCNIVKLTKIEAF